MAKWRKSNWSLQTKILFLTVVLSALVLLVTHWFTTLSSIQVIENTIGEESATASRRLAQELSTSRIDAIPDSYREQLRGLLELEPNIIRVDIYAEIEGKLALIYSTSSRGDRALEGKEIQAFYNDQPDTFITKDSPSRLLYATCPLRFESGQAGFLTVVSSLQAVDDIEATHSRIRLYSLGVTAILMAGSLTWLLRSTVYRSLRHLVGVTHRFRKGESSARVPENLPGEFGELARDFNFMLDAMAGYNDALQAEVKAATSQLASRNRQLQDLNLQLVETQKQLTQAERLSLVGQLTATIAHEIASPLSAVSMQLQLLLESPQANDEMQHRLNLANEQVDRVCGIVESMLTTAHDNMNKVPLRVEEVISKVSMLLGPVMESRQVEYTLRTVGKPFLPDGDSGQLQQLFLNLFNNALDAIQGPGQINVEIRYLLSSTFEATEILEVDICDTGSGIAPERSGKIFEPFFTTKEYGKGTGLGLSVCREIVKRHNGRIFLKSTSPAGTCFTIVLPGRPCPKAFMTERDWKTEENS